MARQQFATRVMRAVLVGVAVGAFALLGALDVAHGAYRTGVAAALLAGANALLLAAR